MKIYEDIEKESIVFLCSATSARVHPLFVVTDRVCPQCLSVLDRDVKEKHFNPVRAIVRYPTPFFYLIGFASKLVRLI